jgi:hypothetical protein
LLLFLVAACSGNASDHRTGTACQDSSDSCHNDRGGMGGGMGGGGMGGGGMGM